MIFALIALGLFLSYANGANDNFKGVATVYGGGLLSYKKSLVLATITTFLGSMTALYLAGELISQFSGKGLVPRDMVAQSSFIVSVATASGLTVMLATLLGLPISTTHALTGSLIGVGLMASPTGINFGGLVPNFLIPLLVSPFISIFLSSFIYYISHKKMSSVALSEEHCLCIQEHDACYSQRPSQGVQTASLDNLSHAGLVTGTTKKCESENDQTLLSFVPTRIMDHLHILSAATVSFARGLNDTPKIASILLAAKMLSPSWALLVVGLMMGVGGLINARKVAETMSHKLTDMDNKEGLMANFTTSLIVIFASKLGLPVSTTHVSCGALFGIGAMSGKAHIKVILTILSAWITTLPMAAILGAITFSIL